VYFVVLHRWSSSPSCLPPPPPPPMPSSWSHSSTVIQSSSPRWRCLLATWFPPTPTAASDSSDWCTRPAPPAPGRACRRWRAAAGCSGCGGGRRPGSRGPDTGPRTTRGTPRSPAASLRDVERHNPITILRFFAFVFTNKECTFVKLVHNIEH